MKFANFWFGYKGIGIKPQDWTLGDKIIATMGAIIMWLGLGLFAYGGLGKESLLNSWVVVGLLVLVLGIMLYYLTSTSVLKRYIKKLEGK